MEFESLVVKIESSLLAKLKAWEMLGTALSFEALESEGILPEDATREAIKEVQAYIKSALFGSIEVLIVDYLESISRRDFIRKSLDLGLRDIGAGKEE